METTPSITVLTQGVPLVERGGFHRGTFEPILERAPQARRDRNVEEDLQAPESGAFGTAGTSGGGVANRAGARPQDGLRRPGVDPEVADELVQRYSVLEPVEELLHRQACAPEAEGAAHARGIQPDRLFERHRRRRYRFLGAMANETAIPSASATA